MQFKSLHLCRLRILMLTGCPIYFGGIDSYRHPDNMNAIQSECCTVLENMTL